MRYLLLIAFVAISNTVTAQYIDTTSAIYKSLDPAPAPSYDLFNFIVKYIRYPVEARRNNIQGKVYVRFVVNEDGSLDSISVLRAIKYISHKRGRNLDTLSVTQLGYGIEEEAIRVVKLLPPFNPGKYNGKPVKVSYTMPLVFKLQ